MGVLVNVQQVRGIDGCIDLRAAQTRVAEQFLKTAQIRTASEQVGGKAVAQGMGCGFVRKAKVRSCLLHHPPDQIGR